MYIYIMLIFITIIIVYFFNSRRVEEVIIEDEIQEVKEQKKELVLYFNTNSVKFHFYHQSTFQSFLAVALYKKIIVNQLWIDEPFHSNFVKILQIIDQSESWIKSKKTKELKIKIRRNDGNFEHGSSFKVYSLRDLSFQFLSKIFDYFLKNRSTKIDIQNTFLASLLLNIRNVTEIKHWCEKGFTNDESTLFLANIILENYTYKNEVIHILNLIQQNHSSINFILDIYDETIRWQREYPYVEKENKNIKELEIFYLKQEESKILISLDTFSC